MVISRIPPPPPSEAGLTAAMRSLEARVKAVEDALRDIYMPRFSSGQSTAKALLTALDLRGLGGRMTVEVWVKSSDAADFFIEGSVDGTNFRQLYTLSVPGGGGENHEGFMNAYPVIRVRTQPANNNEIEVVAAR